MIAIGRYLRTGIPARSHEGEKCRDMIKSSLKLSFTPCRPLQGRTIESYKKNNTES